mmetsp:Transcript_125918/g.314673  ORF Transcript_125918/g.314673 Transcript_125918/m.314673 type:complete len:221 (+) Transcript_125918:475-1137(+)
MGGRQLPHRSRTWEGWLGGRAFGGLQKYRPRSCHQVGANRRARQAGHPPRGHIAQASPTEWPSCRGGHLPQCWHRGHVQVHGDGAPRQLTRCPPEKFQGQETQPENSTLHRRPVIVSSATFAHLVVCPSRHKASECSDWARNEIQSDLFGRLWAGGPVSPAGRRPISSFRARRIRGESCEVDSFIFFVQRAHPHAKQKRRLGRHRLHLALPFARELALAG